MTQDSWRAVSVYNPRLRPEQVTVYDTTLRDGEQAPGVRFTREQKVEIARMLEELGIPEVEVGFPVVSGEEREAVREISSLGLSLKTTALARVRKGDIDAVIECNTDGIILFASVSELHLKHKMRRSFEEVVELSVDAVEYAREHGLSVAFSAEDATRTELERLIQLYRAVEEAGAARVHIPDTAGVATPQAIEVLVGEIKAHLSQGTRLCVHCHNDFGLAVANAIQGIIAGADVAAATVNGIGERAGNASLEELAVALRVLYDLDLKLNLSVLTQLSRLVERYSGIRVQPHKPLVGKNAFAHESGIHVAAVLENPLTYEPFLPEVIGQRRRLVLGKHSGTRAVAAVLRAKGITPSRDEVSAVLRKVKETPGYLTHTLRPSTM
ncbi:homocitrate synthase family protein [Candidatus Pyrohabitans sp.]